MCIKNGTGACRRHPYLKREKVSFTAYRISIYNTMPYECITSIPLQTFVIGSPKYMYGVGEEHSHLRKLCTQWLLHELELGFGIGFDMNGVLEK